MRNHIAKTLGSTGALIYTEIRRCLSLRGGRVIKGAKWIYKTAQELADLFGISERTVRRHLKRIVEFGFLQRFKQDARTDWDQTYWYTWGDEDPFTEAKKCPVQGGHSGRLHADKSSGSSTSSRRGHTEGGNASPDNKQQNIPNADATRAHILENSQLLEKCVPMPKDLSDQFRRGIRKTKAVGFA